MDDRYLTPIRVGASICSAEVQRAASQFLFVKAIPIKTAACINLYIHRSHNLPVFPRLPHISYSLYKTVRKLPACR